MEIYLIRHGESLSDVRRRYDGDYDDPLTVRGRREAAALAKKLAGAGVQVIFCSARIRAVETAQILSGRLRCPVAVEADLNEQDIYGAYRALGNDQPEEEYRRLGELTAGLTGTIPGVETHRSLKARVARSVRKIMASPYEVVAIVTHGGPIRCIVRDTLLLGELARIDNGAIIEIECKGSDVHVRRTVGAVWARPTPRPAPSTRREPQVSPLGGGVRGSQRPS